MKINSITFENFGSFMGGTTIEFGTGYNCIMGTNTTGKSTVLASIHGVLETCVSDNMAVQLVDYQNNDSWRVIIIFDIANPFRILMANPRAIKGNKLYDASWNAGDHPRLQLALNRFCAPNKESVVYIASDRGRYSKQDSGQIDSNNWRGLATAERFQRLPHVFSQIETFELEKEVRDSLIKFFGDTGPGSIILPGRTRQAPNSSKLRTDVTTAGRKHELASAAAGSKEVLFIVCETINLKNSLIMIDEPELHLHPTAQDNLAKYLYWLTTAQGGSNQVIVATHGLSFMWVDNKEFKDPEPSWNVINLAYSPNGSVPTTVIKDGKPSNDFKNATKELGYSGGWFKQICDFHQKYRQEHSFLKHLPSS